MKVLWISTFPPRRCGIGDYSADLVAELARNRDVTLRVLTYLDGSSEGLRVEGGIEVARRLGNRTTSGRIAAEVERFRPDLVHVQSASFLHASFVNRSIAETDTVPLITTVHDAPASARVYYVIPALRRLYRKSSRLIVHSDSVARLLAEYHRIDPRKAVRMPHGVDTKRYTPDGDDHEVRRLFSLEGQRIILYFGFLRPGKGLETLLQAWARIEGAAPDAVLVIAGGTPTDARRYGLFHSEASYPSRLKDLARDLAVTKRTVFTGFVPDELVPKLLAAAEFVVLPYESGPAQSGPVFKALSSGKGIVATSWPGFRETLEDGANATFVPPGDPDSLGRAILALLRDPERAKVMGRRSREVAEAYLDWSVIADQTVRLYGEVLRH